MNNRDLSKKVLASLLTMSFVYLGGTSVLPTAEAGDYTYKYYLDGTGNFSPSTGIHGQLVLTRWDDFKALKDANGDTDAYKQLVADLIGEAWATDDRVNNYMQYTQAVENIILTPKDDNYNGVSDVEINFGSNNFTIQGSDGVYGELLLLGNAGHAGTLTGTGTLKLEHNSSIPSEFALLRVGMNSINPGEKLTINMGQLVIEGKTNSSSGFTGIDLDGYSLGDESKTHDDITVNCDAVIKMENTVGTARGVYVLGHYGTKTSENFKNITIDVAGNKEAQGIRILSGELDGYTSNNLMNIDGNASIKTLSTAGNSFALSTKTGAGSNKINFMGTTRLDSISKNKFAYGIYSVANLTADNTINFAGDSLILVEAQGQGVGSSLQTSDAGKQKVHFAKDAGIEVSSKTSNAYGILTSAISTGSSSGAVNNYDFAGKTIINVVADNQDALGVWSKAQGQDALNEIDFKNGLTIVGTADNGRVTGLWAWADGSDNSQNIINVNGDTAIITGGNQDDYVAQGYGSGTVININQDGGNEVLALGHVFAETGAKVNLKLDTGGSFLNGWLQSNADGEINLVGDGVVVFEGGSQFLNNDPGKTTVDFKNNAVWKMVDSSELTNLMLNSGATLDMTADGKAFSTLTTEKLVGSSGVIKQDIDVRSMESDKVLVTGDFRGTQALDIYQKDNYVPIGGSEEGVGLVLASVNGNGTFTAKDREGTLFYTHYDLANKASEAAGFTTDWYLNKIIKTNESTTSVDTVLAANALNYHTWRTENDKLLQRMGELRHNGEEEQGAWLRVKGSKISRDNKFGFENKYTAYELGYDQVTKRTADKTRYQGVGLSYTDGSSSYKSGNGDNSSKSISFYNTEIGSKGHYLDLVFKISNMDNDFKVFDTNSNKITGDFNNTGVSLSAEYGRKNDLQNGWYIEPQAQFTLGYLGGDSYTASNGINVDQSGIKSAVGRIGFNIGKEVGNKGIVYAKANLLHEFGGGYDVTMTDSTGRVKVSDSFDDTWFEYGLGAALATGKSSHIYFDVERSAGSDFTKDWQWNIGARWNF